MPRKKGKTGFGGHVPFEGKGRLGTKINITFFMGNEILNIFSSYDFTQEATFTQKKVKKNFGVTRSFLMKWGHLRPKMNINFFITNYNIVIIFMLNNFFRKAVFSENCKKQFWGCI